MGDPWNDEGSADDNDWGDESADKDLEDDGLFEPIESDEDEGEDLEDGEQ